jgi:cyclophilin family peptidyl-prolyl cis-trans isomerase
MRISPLHTGGLALGVTLVIATVTPAQTPTPTATPVPGTMAAVLAAAKPADWRGLDPDDTLYLDLPAGRVVLELAPAFAPDHAANVKALVREGYFDGLSVLRVQDNYVTQWGDPDGDDEKKRREVRKAKPTLPAEFDRAISADLPFVPLSDGDLYAPEVGWTFGFPTGRDPKAGKTWLTHCYGALGSARGNAADSGGGTQLFVVIGHAPRHLDRNITVFGRVVQGMDLLSALPRGPGALGFYETPEQRVTIRAMRVAADVPASERVALEILRTDTDAFRALIEARRSRREDWFKYAVGRIELCNVPIPVRPAQNR